MSGSYILAYTRPATESRPARSGSSRYDTLFWAYEDILYSYAEYPAPGEVNHIYRASPDGRPAGEPLLTVHFNEDGSREESGPLALPRRTETSPSCPGCSSETGICFHRYSPALTHIHRGGRIIGEIATFADEGAPDGPLYSVLILTDPCARFRVSSPSELLPRVVEHVNSSPRFLYERLAA
ncbi:MAG: hypothetical protein OXF11_01125 [Deltaproteobacteria bacterium]|nr:hypothetical protein [Deltaproteobacteria bacterium]